MLGGVSREEKKTTLSNKLLCIPNWNLNLNKKNTKVN